MRDAYDRLLPEAGAARRNIRQCNGSAYRHAGSHGVTDCRADERPDAHAAGSHRSA